jgi:hypothetical protein
MQVGKCIARAHFPCDDVRHDGYLVPNADVRPDAVSVVMISEAAPADPRDYYYAKKELALFPCAEVLMLMGDVAIKALNYVAKRAGERRVVPAGSTYKIPSILPAGRAELLHREEQAPDDLAGYRCGAAPGEVARRRPLTGLPVGGGESRVQPETPAGKYCSTAAFTSSSQCCRCSGVLVMTGAKLRRYTVETPHRPKTTFSQCVCSGSPNACSSISCGVFAVLNTRPIVALRSPTGAAPPLSSGTNSYARPARSTRSTQPRRMAGGELQ